ncbi:coagulation factor IX-like [Culex quinquefasciatus]|uniref:coagulation factor IX-like n=1 Tax=Culex quinquefasciatus TaxID=7176 RepID=UPI0018E33140|nr:coagulation factor IX-like [Culex quinquefasciatus]
MYPKSESFAVTVLTDRFVVTTLQGYVLYEFDRDNIRVRVGQPAVGISDEFTQELPIEQAYLSSEDREDPRRAVLFKLDGRLQFTKHVQPISYPGQFPWHVAVYHRITRNQANFVCGGSLISRSFVLTADHCTRTATGAELESDGLLVQLGLHDMESTNWATFQQSAVEDIFRVLEGARWAGMRNDIALLELSSTG